jgi:hypothetical protein
MTLVLLSIFSMTSPSSFTETPTGILRDVYGDDDDDEDEGDDQGRRGDMTMATMEMTMATMI